MSGYLEEVTDHGMTGEAWNAMSRAERNDVDDRLRAAVVEKESDVVAELRAELGSSILAVAFPGFSWHQTPLPFLTGPSPPASG